MIEFKSMREIVEYTAKTYGDKTAYIVKTKENGKAVYDNISYNRFSREVKYLGKYFINVGLGAKRIAVIGRNCYKWVLVYFGTLAADSVIVPLDRGLFPDEINEQLSRSEADIVFYTEDISEKMEDVSIKKICVDSDEFDRIVKQGEELADDKYKAVSPDGNKMSILLFTSGTTNTSKAVMLSQCNITSNMYAMSCWEDFRETDVNMAILPFHHTFGMTQMILFASHGMCTVFCEGLRVAKCLNEYHVSMFVAVPRILEEMYKIIIRTLKKQKKLGMVKAAFVLSSFLKKFHIDITGKLFKPILDQMGGALRFIIVGAAPADPEVLKFFRNLGVIALQGYGLTETAPTVAAENHENMRRGSVGKPIPGEQVKIVDPDENGIGEIAVCGKNVMLGYYRDEEKTAEVMQGDWFFTGDMGRIDKDGFLFITGRKKNVIVLANGKNVFPEEIEYLIARCRCVKESVVYFDKESSAICADIVYDKSYDVSDAEKEINAHMESVNKKLPQWKKVRRFNITDKEFEKTTTLKIKRH